jgi:hypothetical protein
LRVVDDTAHFGGLATDRESFRAHGLRETIGVVRGGLFAVLLGVQFSNSALLFDGNA